MLIPLFFACTENTKTATLNQDAPTVEWYVGQGSDLEEHVHEGLQTRDGGYVAIGETMEGPNDDGMGDILIIKVDADGALEWQQTFGTENVPEVGIAISETADGDFIAGLGLAESESMQSALMKLDSQGTVLWKRTYPHSGHGAIRGIEILDSGNVVATGYRNAVEPGFQFIADEGEAFIMQTDANGEPLWDQTMDASQGTKVKEAVDGGFMVLSTGWISENDADKHAAMLIKTDQNGVQEWIKTYRSNGMNQAFDFDRTSDGGYVLAGHTTGYGSANWDCLMIRTDAGGEVLWERAFGNPRGYDPEYVHDECYGIRQMSDGGFIMVGGTGDEYDYSESGHPAGGSDEWKAYVVRTNGEGDLVWEAIYGDGPDAGNNATEYLALTEDGGFMLFNDTDSTGEMAPNNFGFLKLSPEP